VDAPTVKVPSTKFQTSFNIKIACSKQDEAGEACSPATVILMMARGARLMVHLTLILSPQGRGEADGICKVLLQLKSRLCKAGTWANAIRSYGKSTKHEILNPK
jgi:hypothetical protein